MKFIADKSYLRDINEVSIRKRWVDVESHVGYYIGHEVAIRV